LLALTAIPGKHRNNIDLLFQSLEQEVVMKHITGTGINNVKAVRTEDAGPEYRALLDEYGRHLLARSLSEATIRSMCSQARIFLAYCSRQNWPLAALSKAEVAEFWISRGEDCSHSAMRNVRVGLSSLLRWLVATDAAPQGLFSALPSVTGRATRIKSLYTEEEIARVLASIDRTGAIGKRDYAMILLAASIAPRALDVIRLKVEDIDWARSKITFVLHKKGRLHTAALVPAVGNAILDYLLGGRPDSDSPCLFVASRPPYGGLVSSSSCASILRKHLDKAGVDPAGRTGGFHAFRARGASRLLAQGFSLSVISEYLGHADPDSVMDYLTVDEEGMRSCCLPLDGIEARGALR
jgi:integrase